MGTSPGRYGDKLPMDGALLGMHDPLPEGNDWRENATRTTKGDGGK
jgi:hypothetical protein